MTQKEFLNRYNTSQTVGEALSKSISAAVGHNKLYNNATNFQKEEIRCFWREKLLEIAKDFSQNSWDEDKHNKKIDELKQIMNTKFGDLINFRISHSQKSISVFIKHLWCIGNFPLPPQCPVDRIILTRINAPYNERSWGFIDDIETHIEKINLIKLAAKRDGFESIAEWELLNFN